MSENLDLISPPTIGQDMIAITVDPVSLPLLVSRVITLNFDYAATFPAGVVLPLILQVQPAFGRGAGYFEKVFRRTRPNSFAFAVAGAGEYLVVLRECGHNYWQGRLLLEVEGEEFSQIQSTRQEI